MNQIAETTLTIDLGALAHNYHYIKHQLKPETKFLGVVKAFAYGSDMVAVAQKLADLGADYLAVAYTKEGALLRAAGIQTPILVLHPQAVNFKQLIQEQLTPNLYSLGVLQQFLATAKAIGVTQYPVHLKFNTGLNRLGFAPKEVPALLRLLKEENTLAITGLLSHLAASEDPKEQAFSLGQIAAFNKIAEQIGASLGYMPLRHMLNTSGILNYPTAHLDMVRSGIGLYGYGNHAAIDAQLKPVANLKTVISQLHQLSPGQSVGYNRAYTSQEKRTTATLPIGHADGIGRIYGNGKGQVWIHGQKAPIIGNVCMDMIMVDVTHIPCQAGDPVTLFGAGHSAEDFAQGAGTISYEVLTAISPRVKRIVKR